MNNRVYAPLSSVLFLAICFIYGSGFYQLVQSSVLLTLLLTLVFPIVFWPLIKKVDNDDEIKRILFLETGFNLLCFLAISHWIQVGFIDKGLVVFFLFQAGGFIFVQLKKQATMSALISLCLAAAIAYWIIESTQTQLKGDGALLLFGQTVPWQLKVIYGAWLAQLLLVEYRYVLPKITLMSCHIASYFIAIHADDFFHARIITASHLLFLALCFDFKSMDWGGRQFATSTMMQQFVSRSSVQHALSASLLAIALSSLGTLLLFH
ncbi:hypothetical protein [Vibrio penaeicida]|uniref:Uncharacterized protein n=1 Tax=Vibrio penaeicida TaxID=104609 RepID=A0AAV5NUF6_9VIBR|nr:hypothetical protein [Vibrio penaeicida]RTZ22615.1 hypothetical protein EKN09_13205 [Vibrio penaeicida]GLQ73909.1 hypothetical protein GCM10007932_32690 [Vibrio penaeicida]